MMPDGGTHGGTQTDTNDISNLAGGILRSYYYYYTPVVLHVTHCVG